MGSTTAGPEVDAAPVALHISPHPDDEVLGAPSVLLALRRSGWRVVNFVATMGRPDARARRRREAAAATSRAGFELLSPDVPIELSSTDDPGTGFDRVRSEVGRALDEVRPSIVIAPSPHDGHHAHELVARAVLAALADLADRPRLWLWGIWADLPLPTIFAPFDEELMEEAQEVLRLYAGEVARNDYCSLLTSRARADAILGSERVFGYGSPAASTKPYADLLTECIPTTDGWAIASGRHFDASREPAEVETDSPIEWWLDSPSPHEAHRRLRAGRRDRSRPPSQTVVRDAFGDDVYIGIDVGATKIDVVRFDADLNAHDEPQTIPTPTDDVHGAARFIIQAVRRMQHSIDREVTAIGIGTPGQIDPESGFVRNAVNLGIVEPLDLAGLIANEVGVPCAVDNDVNVAALGAYAKLVVAGVAQADLVFLNVGTGLAAGVVLDGELRRGVAGAAGEIGHLPAAHGGARCGCGQFGCIETVASGRAIERSWAAGGGTAESLVTAARAGDDEAIALQSVVADHVAHAIQALTVTLDVRPVVIGGGAGLALIDSIRDECTRRGHLSTFVGDLDLPGRIVAKPDGPIEAAGAAALARTARLSDRGAHPS